MKSYFFIIVSYFTVLGTTYGNNIKVSNVALGPQDQVTNRRNVSFDVSWENSWRIPTNMQNWDAAWVFLKIRNREITTWTHGSIVHNDAENKGVTPGDPDSCSVDTNDDGGGNAKGAFVYYSKGKTRGRANFTVTLRWAYGVDGYTNEDSCEISVHAIEMVFVPEGSFQLGGDYSNKVNNSFAKGDDANSPYIVNSSASISINYGNTGLRYNNSTAATPPPVPVKFGDHSGPIPNAFPKGYKAFYCMKYEVTQSDYVEFLNKLTPTQDAARFPNHPAAGHQSRQNIRGGTAGSRTTTAPFIPVTRLNWQDMAAYLDWTALRPMTEMEYEKACRGTGNNTVNGEFAWGNVNSIEASDPNYVLINEDLENERISNYYIATGVKGNANFTDSNPTGTNGPFRVGIFADNTGNNVSSSTNRVCAGATYYGIMEMTGNVAEVCIGAGTTSGRAFDGQHGDGELAANGNANVPNWCNTPTTLSGVSARGGAYNLNALYFAPVSSRELAVITENAAYNFTGTDRSKGDGFGIRGVRTAP